MAGKAGTRGNCISLFCGSGGLDTGFTQAGFNVGLAYDIEEAAIATHRRNHPGSSAELADLSKLQPEEILQSWRERYGEAKIAGVIGGPPCQAFSVGNVHKREDDPRAALPLHYANILKYLNQKVGLDFFLFENVSGLLGDGHSHQLMRFRRLFEEAGFLLFEKKMDAVDYGVAQFRPRVIIVGLNAERYQSAPAFEFPSPRPGRQRTVRDAIGGLPDPVFFNRELSKSEFHPNHWCMNPKSKKFSEGKLSPGKVWGRCFRTLEWDRPSWTVAYGHREVHVHPGCKRRLSIYEAMQLQGFPKKYELMGTLSDQIRLVSDAVPPPLGKALAGAIGDYLSDAAVPSKAKLSAHRKVL